MLLSPRVKKKKYLFKNNLLISVFDGITTSSGITLRVDRVSDSCGDVDGGIGRPAEFD